MNETAMLTVHVKPSARTDELLRYDETGTLWIQVKAAPNAGKANELVIKTVAKALGCPPSSVLVANGATGQIKRLQFSGMSKEKLVESIIALNLSN